MMNSEEKTAAQAVLDRLLEDLDRDRVRDQIDDPIDGAVSSFEFPKEEIQSHQQFIQIVGEFIAHLYRHGLAFCQTLTPSQARGEALQLLEQGYVGKHATGFSAALLDATDPNQGGISIVLYSLAGIVRGVEREKYARWVCASHVDPLDWRAKCELVKAILERFQAYLPPYILQCAPAQLADLYPILIGAHLQTSSAFGGTNERSRMPFRGQQQQ